MSQPNKPSQPSQPKTDSSTPKPPLKPSQGKPPIFLPTPNPRLNKPEITEGIGGYITPN